MSDRKIDPIERLLIASLVQSPGLLAEISSVVQPADFVTTQLADIYRLMLTRGVFDVSVILNMLDASTISALGGAAEISALRTLAPSSDPAGLAKIVREESERRLAANALNVAASRIVQHRSGIADAINDAITSIAAQTSPQAACYDAGSVEVLLDRFVTESDFDIESGFGIGQMDYMIGGIRGGRLYIIAGYPGSGKTTLMIQAAIRAAKQRRVVFVSGEMTASQVVAAAIAHLGQVDMSPMQVKRRQRGGDQDGKSRMEAGKEAYKQLHLTVIEHQAPDLASLNLYMQRYRPSVLICDYLQIMRPPEGAQNREQEVNANARGLKAIAMQYNAAVITGSQLNRLGQVRESDAPLHHCDVLIRIDLDEGSTGPDAKVTLNLVKNRGGQIGTLSALFRKQFSTFAASATF